MSRRGATYEESPVLGVAIVVIFVTSVVVAVVRALVLWVSG